MMTIGLASVDGLALFVLVAIARYIVAISFGMTFDTI